MSVSIAWPTKVINVPRADLTLVQSTPTEIRNMDINWFRLALKDLEDDENGILFPNTHSHNTEVSLGGLTYARVIEILSPYTITFEDGAYAVNLVGANSNIGDRVNVNQVSVRSSNSAGLISSPEIQFATFESKVTVDVNSGFSGTVFPAGTPLRPVNNLNDALIIAAFRGLSEIHTLSALTIETGHDLAGMVVSSNNNWPIVTIQAGALIDNTNFKKVALNGVMSGLWNVLDDCWSIGITNFCGWVRDGSVISVTMAAYTLANTGQSYFDDLKPFYPGVTSTITTAQDTAISLTGCTDIVTLAGLTAGSKVVAGLTGGGSLTIASSCVGGTIQIAGVGAFTNQSSLYVDTSGLMKAREIETAAFDGSVVIDVASGVSGILYPTGTKAQPSNNLADAKTVAAARNITNFHVIGSLTIASGHSIAGLRMLGRGPNSSIITLASGSVTNNAYFEDCQVTGDAGGVYVRLINCRVNNVTGLCGDIRGSTLFGVLTIGGSEPTSFITCYDGVNPGAVELNCGGSGRSIEIRDYHGGLTISNKTGSENLTVNFSAGRLSILSSVTSGVIVVRGVGEIASNDGAATLNSSGLVSSAGVWQHVIESGLSATEVLRLITSVMAGKSSGGGTSTIKFRNLENSKDRVVATVDNSGNRSALVLDGS